MERIFNSVGNGSALSRGFTDFADGDEYEASVRAMIVDAVDFNESTLMPDREEALSYYYGDEPRLAGDSEPYDSTSILPEEGDEPARSTIVSTDVRDTIMAVLPSLMRIFASTEHVITYGGNTEEQAEQAKQATDYIRHKFWNDNPGFLLLYGAFKDALSQKMGILTWDTKTRHETSEKDYGNVTYEEVVGLLGEDEENQLVDYTPMRPDGTMEKVTLRFVKSKPQLVVEGVPLDEFRVARNSGIDIQKSTLVGRERIIPASDLIADGYDPDIVLEYTGASYAYYEERYYRNPGEATFAAPLGDMVRFGEYYMRIDQDGDGIAELRRIRTIGDNYDILEDVAADYVKYAVFGPDPRPHVLVGDSLADLSMDIQRINTNLIRGALDSLAQTINPRTGINETLVNVEDALNDDIGAVIRSRGNPNETLTFYQMPWVGADAFAMKEQVDRIRISRTGISEASKGLDPKALQSTAVMGVDLIANGAQERIELIARIFAETGLKDLYKGLLQEVSDWPNREEIIEIRGKFIPVNPSNFEASMKINVNPAMGKGSDMTRLQALGDIAARQEQIIAKFGVKNPVVGPEEYRNTIVDMLELVNIKDVSRYFKMLTPEVIKGIMETPEEPSPELILAQSKMEEVKMKGATTQATLDQKEASAIMDDDFRRDELNITTFVDLVGILADFQTAEVPEDTVGKAQSLNSPV